jgi:hypothetical protein
LEFSGLEERWTPAVNAVSFLMTTPTPGALHTAAFTGIVSDTHANPVTSAGLALSYHVTDASGHVLTGGTVPFDSQGGVTLPFKVHIPASDFPPGQVETVTFTARDSDTPGGVSASTTVALSGHSSPGVADIALVTNGVNGDFQARGRGRVASFRGTGNNLALGGQGTFVEDGGSDVGRIHAEGTGRFSAHLSPEGEVRTGFAAQRALVQLQGIVQGGLTTTLQGPVQLRRRVDHSLSFAARGRVFPTVNGLLGQVQGGGQGGIHIRTDGQGVYQLRVVGSLRVKGDVHPSGPPSLL